MSAADGRHLQELRSKECVFPSPPAGCWQGEPGRVLRGPNGALALNFAPARWLLLATGDHWDATATAAGALLFDTDSKWHLLELPSAHAAIHSALDLQSTLEGRECAASVMFDTPVVIARDAANTGLLVCVPASYVASFLVSIEAWR